MRSFGRSAGAALLGLVLAACTAGPVEPRAPDLVPLVERVPARVVVVYDEVLVAQQCTISKGYIAASWDVAIGDPTVATFDRLFRAMFDDVEVLGAREVPDRSGDRPVIRLTLERFTGCDMSWPIFGQPVAIAYRASVSRAGVPVLDSWAGQGVATAADYQSSPGEAPLLLEEKYIARMTELAIRSAAADFAINFEDDPAVRTWKQGLRAGARDG